MLASIAPENSSFSLAALKIHDPYGIYLETDKSDRLTIQTGFCNGKLISYRIEYAAEIQS